MVKKDSIEWLRAFITLKELGYDRIYTTFSGSGDDGDIEDICLLKPDEDKDAIEYEDRQNRRASIGKDIIKDIEDRVYDLLNALEDWWNGDGGGGNIMIDLNTKTYEIENYVNVTNTVDYTSSGNFLKDED